MGSCFSSTVDERPAVHPQPYVNTGKTVAYEQPQYPQQQYTYAQQPQYVYAQPQQYVYAQAQPQYVYAQPQYVQQQYVQQPQYYGQQQQMSTGTAIVGGMVAGAVLQEVLFD